MVTLQILNKILQTSSINLIIDNNLQKEQFIGYENEFEFILNHYKQYGQVPNKETFLSKFQNFDLIEVTESDKYLINAFNEEWLYYKSVPVVQKVAELLKSNSNDAVEYLLQEIPNLQNIVKTNYVDIIKNANDRLIEYEQKLNGDSKTYITTGFPELDTIFKGFSKGEELVVLFARIGQGKSWILSKMLSHAWEIGLNVGMISPEMSPTKIGYRFDTLVKNFSNKNLVWGNEEKNYKNYIMDLQTKQNKFIVAIPKDFDKKITVSKLKSFVEKNKLDILGIDGITYLTDERYKKGDNRTTMLTNISEDLMNLSIELKIPILVVVQSNRSGIRTDEDENATPDLENIKDSDGIAANATKVLAISQNGAGLNFGIKKHRDGITGQKLIYNWNIDKGEFQYIPSNDDGLNKQDRDKKINKIKKEFKDNEDVF